MIFTTSKRVTKMAESPLKYVESPAMTFSNKYRNYSANLRAALELNTTAAQSREPVAVETSAQYNKPPIKQMKWGQPTWFLFHTLAEKVKPEHFQEVRSDLLNIIYTICSNLPCPDCAKHATTYLNSINFNAIQTKDALRFMLFQFHNEVNRRKKYPEMPVCQLSEKYSVANTINIIHYFMPFFEDKHASIRMIADDMHRSRVALQMKAWFNKNIECFEL
jgi:hypothetical protein